MNLTDTSWLLLIVSLPSSRSTARIRIWRALKALGCGALRDGAYLLPERGDERQQLAGLAEETVREGGSAWLVTVLAQSADEDETFRALFERGAQWGQFVKDLVTARRLFASQSPQDINRALRKARREYEAVLAIDYFPNEASAAAEAAWMDFLNAAESLLSPGEPHAIAVEIAPRDTALYQGRTWATRRRLWVDRVASAWLIRGFIDPQARLLWLESPEDCPPDALGFDFDGATFTHVAERVTFEVLLASFGLAQDPGLARLGAMVRALDVGAGFVPEAAGFEAMMAGTRQHASDDDALLAAMSAVLDALYAHFSKSAAEPVKS
jgi:hypothetical protein